MSFAVIMAGCVLFGLLVGRWWALVAALALGVRMAVVIDPWEVSKFYVGCAWAVAGGLGIALGVAVRKLGAIGSGSGDHKRARVS